MMLLWCCNRVYRKSYNLDETIPAEEGEKPMLALLLIEGDNVSQESLRTVSLRSAKQLVTGEAFGFGVILHVNANSVENLNYAVSQFAQVQGVTAVTILATRAKG
jgi:hypothetical protein